MYKLAPCMYALEKTGKMRVEGLVIASDELMRNFDLEEPLKQVQNVASLPGIVGYSIAMPDMHWGYGFPIGGVAAFDMQEGIISPGGVGYDINCGVRLSLVPLRFDDLTSHQKEALLQEIFRRVPAGVGHGHKGQGLTADEYDNLLTRGALYSIEKGYGFFDDLEHIESRGCIPQADSKAVSHSAKERGKQQLGSIGSGNHFVEIGAVQQIFSSEIASKWGVEEGQIYILIHSGSRGLGHQVCQDTLDHFVTFTQDLPDKQLAYAPLSSLEGRRYFSAMAAAANYAFNNRQQILHHVRLAFQHVLKIAPQEIKLLYDVCHNIAKFEEHEVGGKMQTLCVHRKGATRAFGPHSKELAPLFQKTGQPVFVPGDMGRASYILAGLGNPLTWCSSSHGAGRARSRVQSKKMWQHEDPYAHMKKMGVQVKASSMRTIVEEMPDAYKDVELVVEATEEAKLATKVARLRPRLVIKG